MAAGNQPRFTFSDSRFEVLGFVGREAISELFAFEVDLVTRSRTIDFAALLDKPAHLTVAGPNGSKRIVQGIVVRFEVTATLPERVLCRALLGPPQTRLTLKRKLRVFQDQSAQQIVTQVLQEAGVSGLEWKLREPTTPRNYCVQYRETDQDFVARLLEEEGIACHFEHTEEELKTILVDDGAARKPISGAAQVSYNVTTSAVPDQEFVRAFGFGQRLVSGKVQLRDYSFKKPRVPLEGVASGLAPSLEVYDYPGEFVDPSLGQRLAKVRLEELQQSRQTGSGQGDCVRFLPGFRFTLGGGAGHHPFEQLNQEYLLVAVQHVGHQPAVLGEESQQGATSYSNSFSVIPATVPFRPQRVTPRPQALGVHTAVVLGPSGEQIYVDKYGRVKVRFHWDRDEKATSWVRVSQEWAGSSYGSLFIPRVGQEVLVSFLAGDPDRPVVTGRVHNAEQVTPYALPRHETRSTIKSCSSPASAGDASDVTEGLQSSVEENLAAFNELRFEDSQGAEEVYLHAQRDQRVEVKHDRTTLVRNDRFEKVLSSQRVTVGNTNVVEVADASVHSADNIVVEAAEKLIVKVGGSSIVIEPSSIKIGGPELLSSALQVNDLRGGQMSLNGGQSSGSAGSALLAAGLQAATPLLTQLLGKGAGQAIALAKLLASGASLKSLVQSLGKGLLQSAVGAVMAQLPQTMQTVLRVASSAAPLISAVASGQGAAALQGLALGAVTGVVGNAVGGALGQVTATFFGAAGQALGVGVGAVAGSALHSLIGGSGSGSRSASGSGSGSSESFGGLMEEGYGKAFGTQGYEGMGGSPQVALEQLTGGTATTQFVSPSSQHEVWGTLSEAQAQSYPTLATSGPGATSVAPGTSYPVAGVREEDGVSTVQLLDPQTGAERSVGLDHFCSDFRQVSVCRPPS